ncbi:MAG: hypothetical protein M1815_001692, partial [Lichina confinis]
ALGASQLPTLVDQGRIDIRQSALRHIWQLGGGDLTGHRQGQCTLHQWPRTRILWQSITPVPAHIVGIRKAVPRLTLVFSSGDGTGRADGTGKVDGTDSSSSSSRASSRSSSSRASSSSSTSTSTGTSGSANDCGSMGGSRRAMCESTECASSRTRTAIFLWPSAGFRHGRKDWLRLRDSASGFGFKIRDRDSRRGLHVGF